MKRVLLLAVISALSIAGAAQAKGGPVTKQNGSAPVLSFTSICSVPRPTRTTAICGGDVTKFTDVDGKLNAVQAKRGRYNLDFAFSNLTPGVEYRLWSTRSGTAWVEVGRMFADAVRIRARTSFRRTSPSGLGFDLNTISGDITIVTSWWSDQQLSVNPDGSLAAG